MTEQQHYPIHTVVSVTDKDLLLRINFEDISFIRGGTEKTEGTVHLVSPRTMYEYGYKCVEKSGEIWTWVYKPASTTPPAKRGRPKKTE